MENLQLQSFIPKTTVLIAWNPYDNSKLNRKIELKVFLWNEEEIKKYDRLSRKMDPYYSFAATDGSCSSHWNQLTVAEVICECWRILLDYPSLPVKPALIEFGKIAELESVRLMTFRTLFRARFN